MIEPLLHVMFGCSAAAGLRAYLADHDRLERVVAPRDDLSFGPIDRPADPSRSHWVEDELGITEWDGIVAENAQFIESSCADAVFPVAWFSRRSASEYAGFLWWLSHRQGDAFKVIDVTDFRCSNRTSAATGVLSSADFDLLVDAGTPLSTGDALVYRDVWKRLEKENAPLRVIGPHQTLESVGLDHFDSLVLSCSTPEWRKMARIIGEALASFWESGLYQTSDLVLYARICELAEAKRLDWRGDLSNMQNCELRLPPAT